MKFLFDNCLSFRIAHAIKSLAEAEGDEVIHLRDRFNQTAADTEWLLELGSEGGWVVISADTRILKSPHERKAWQQAKLVGFFLAPAWLKMKMWDQSWHLVRRWPKIREQANLAVAGSSFEVPIKSQKFRPIPVP